MVQEVLRGRRNDRNQWWWKILNLHFPVTSIIAIGAPKIGNSFKREFGQSKFDHSTFAFVTRRPGARFAGGVGGLNPPPPLCNPPT